jgi:hypothetical protein
MTGRAEMTRIATTTAQTRSDAKAAEERQRQCIVVADEGVTSHLDTQLLTPTMRAIADTHL